VRRQHNLQHRHLHLVVNNNSQLNVCYSFIIKLNYSFIFAAAFGATAPTTNLFGAKPATQASAFGGGGGLFGQPQVAAPATNTFCLLFYYFYS
jgi:hypothetical protein